MSSFIAARASNFLNVDSMMRRNLSGTLRVAVFTATVDVTLFGSCAGAATSKVVEWQ